MTAKRTLKVLLAASEAVPFAKTGGLGDVAGTLPTALQQAGAQVNVVLPRYASLAEDFANQLKAVATLAVPFNGEDVPCTVWSLQKNGVGYYFLDHPEYFSRDNLYGYDDDCKRFAFFSRAICEAATTVEEMSCRVIHCNDWQTALVPVYLSEYYGAVKNRRRMKTVFTVHNAAFQGAGPAHLLVETDLLGCPVAATAATRDNGDVNFMQAALSYADHISTVSPTYVHELQTAYFGEGLDPAFRRRAQDFTGILNGIDYEAWNPETDKFLENPYAADSMEGKAQCKAALQAEFGLPVDADRPLVVMVTRLTDQKGVGMVVQEIDRLMERSVQMIVLGTGDPYYEQALVEASWRHPQGMAAAIRFDNGLSHRMYAGADMLLMPSAFEPCGLSQIIAMRYGTLPVVRETGGLKDSVTPYNCYTGEGTGFSFANLDGYEMGSVLLYACEVFWQDKAAWNQLVQQAMTADFTWSRAAQSYLDIYQSALNR